MYMMHVCCVSSSLHELVKHEENGLIFKDSAELAEQLKVRLTQRTRADERNNNSGTYTGLSCFYLDTYTKNRVKLSRQMFYLHMLP